MDTLEGHYRDMCDIEFTIEKRTFWLLQTRIGKRTAFAEWVMAHDMLDEGLIDQDEALSRVDANRLEELFKRVIAEEAAKKETPIAQGLNASPGAATGRVVFSADDAQEWASRGERVILVRRETTPDDYHGMIAAQGILTSAGGTNSHAAVVARGEGIPAVCGADAIKLNVPAKTFTANGVTVSEGDVITIDGFTGRVFVGELPLEESILEKARAGDDEARTAKIWQAFERLMRRADEVRRLRVRANADTPDQATNARDRGAEGIGLCRTEHMFLGEERVMAVRTMIFAETPEEEQQAYDVADPAPARRLRRHLHGHERSAGDGAAARPAPARVPARPGVAGGRGRARPGARRGRERAGARAAEGERPARGQPDARPARRAPGHREARPVRDAGARDPRGRLPRQARGRRPHVEIMIPLVATAPELQQMRAELEPVAAEVQEREGVTIEHLEWGTMVELPRAAVTAAEIAASADFFSFGTNDLTQTAFGFSRDDIGKFVGMYEERKLVPANPFVTIDVPGVGRLMSIASEEGRAANDHLHLGICGEHGGDPASVMFCHRIGLDYVSCSPFRVETARLAAGQAAVGDAENAST